MVALAAWRRRRMPGATPLLALMLALVGWSVVNVLELGSLELEVKLFWANLEYLGIVIVPVMWLVFALQYTGREKYLTYRNLALLLIIPVITVFLAWTNNLHGLMRYNIRLDTSGPFSVVAKTYGMWFWVNAAYSYGLLLVGTVVLLQVLFRTTTSVPWTGQGAPNWRACTMDRECPVYLWLQSNPPSRCNTLRFRHHRCGSFLGPPSFPPLGHRTHGLRDYPRKYG